MSTLLEQMARRIVALERLTERLAVVEYPLAGGGAPTAAEYVTTAERASLSAEVTIPGLAGSPDRAGIGGAGNSWEFDSAVCPLTWSAAPAVMDCDTTIPSHLYARIIDSTAYQGLVAWVPGAGAFDARCHLSLGALWLAAGAGYVVAGLLLTNADETVRIVTHFNLSVDTRDSYAQVYRYSTPTWTQEGSNWNIGWASHYIRITRGAANDITCYFSGDGTAWTLIASFTLAITVAKIGFRFTASGTNREAEMASDWLRTNV